MKDLTSFSFRISKSLARSIEAAAKRLGLTKSEYARRAMEEFDQRMMQERMAELSRRLSSQSAAAARSMDASSSDGLA
jgi:predicted transcriptional regulator